MTDGDRLSSPEDSELEMLKTEKELVDQALDGMADTFFIFEIASGAPVKWNKSFRTVSGFSDEEIRSSKFPGDWFDEADARRVAMTIEENMNGGRCHPQEMELITRNGNRIMFEYTCTLLQDETGRLRWLAALGRDATERNLVEDYLSWQLKVTGALTRLYKPTVSARGKLNELFPVILDEARKLTGSKSGYVSLIDPESGDNVIYTDKRRLSVRMESHCRVDGEGRLMIPADANGQFPGMAGRVLNTGEAFYANSPEKEAPDLQTGNSSKDDNNYSRERFLSVPIFVSGKVAGQIALAGYSRDYSERDLEAVQRIVSFFSLALMRKDN